MKKYLLSFLFCVFVVGIFAQSTKAPSYENSKPWSTSVELVGVITTDDDVFIALAIAGKYAFNGETYLEYINPASGKVERVYMKDSWRNTGEDAARFAMYGFHYLSLLFPPIPNGVNKINLISERPKVYGISIHPVVRAQKKENKRIAKSEKEVEKMIKESNLTIAGFYEPTMGTTRFAIVQQDSVYLLYAGDDGNDGGLKYGERIGTLRPTSISGIYKTIFYENETPDIGGTISFDAVSMTIKIPEEESIICFKMGDSISESNEDNDKSTQWSGTGFAISNNYVITNNHVIDDAKNIVVKSIKGDVNANYSAEVVATDKVNDIAIIKITDSRFTGFGTIPYSVQARMADVGEDVFVLGYPLTQALGNEIKLTNGIVSSRTGYQGDISTYQISAPIQPGNSGGPMFDRNGNIIGIVVAGVPGAENVGYAIKTSYLRLLIESVGLNVEFPNNNTISTLSLAEKVKRVKNFVLYIECGK